MKQIRYLIVVAMLAGCSAQMQEGIKDEITDSSSVVAKDTIVAQELEEEIQIEEESEDSMMARFARQEINKEQIISTIEEIYSNLRIEYDSVATYRMENVRVRKEDAVPGYEYAFYRNDSLAMKLIFTDLETGEGKRRKVVYAPSGSKLMVRERQDLEFCVERIDSVFGNDGRLKWGLIGRSFVDDLGEDFLKVCEYEGEDSTVRVLKGDTMWIYLYKKGIVKDSMQRNTKESHNEWWTK